MKVYCAEAGGGLPRIYDWVKDREREYEGVLCRNEAI